MIKKVIALIFVSFFVMSGLTVLNENNQNYNISENNSVNSFTSSSNNYYNFSFNQTITYSSGISSGGQTFVSYNDSLYYINNSYIMQFNILNQKISIFLNLSSNPKQLEIYNNYLIIGYGNGENSASATSINIYNFFNNQLSLISLPNAYSYMQFSMNGTSVYLTTIEPTRIYTYSLNLLTSVPSLLITGYTDSVPNQFAVSSYNNSLIFAINTGGGVYTLCQFGYVNAQSQSISSSISNSGNYFGNIYNIIDLGNCGLLGSQSYYITDSGSGGTTQYSYNSYSNGLYFSDSNNKNTFLPISLVSYSFNKLSTYNSTYQIFNKGYNTSYVYLPIGNGNTIFNSLTYIINGKHNLYIVNKNNVYVYSYNLRFYNLNVKSYTVFDKQINNYFSFEGIIYNGLSNNFILTSFPQKLIPLNTSTYYYNSSSIKIIESDFSGSGSNLYYNLSIYYNQVQAPSIPLYDIFTYMYPISIIGLFVGMGSFIFVIKKRGYKI